jgi:hypothetical protein
MSELPFDKPTGKRRYQCFVCGQQFESYEDYKGHILDSHEESREYVVCPLARCGCPVRCVRAHFKVKHPYEEIPKKGQMKALVWKDRTTKGGLEARKPKFREGYLLSTKNGGKEMHYRSGMECDVYECLEAMPEVIGYEVEPFAVQYTFEGTVHEYNPDLKVSFSDGRIEIWEIKPANQTTLPRNSAKWTACNQYCQARGFGFMVLTEVGMSKLKQQIKNMRNLQS